jgi:hypothetical protein
VTERSAVGSADGEVALNIEGAAGDVVLGTPVDLWENVAEVIFDCEPNGPYEAGQLIDHLEKSGLVPETCSWSSVPAESEIASQSNEPMP